ncbi:hypothetical protein [Niallia sp.]|nr:hypothetical protein [Niallia sp.]
MPFAKSCALSLTEMPIAYFESSIKNNGKDLSVPYKGFPTA